MKQYGEIYGTTFHVKGWCIYHLAHEVRLTLPSGDQKTIYVDDMQGIRNAITHYLGESHATG